MISGKEKLLIVAVLFVSAAAFGNIIGNSLFKPLEQPAHTMYSADGTPLPKKTADDRTVNFLLLGVDERSGDIGRSDTMMVLSVNLGTKRIGLISIPRDTRVPISIHGEDKINHAYAYGGPALAGETVEKTTGMSMDHYITINFKSFKNIVDLIGGIDINVEKDMHYEDPYDGEDGFIIDIRQGRQHLDGEKAIQYVRFRDEEGDIGRVRRQQAFLNAALEKVTSADIIPKLPSIIKESRGAWQTDMDFSDIIEYLSYLDISGGYSTKAIMLPGKPEMIDDISYWIPDYGELQKELESMDAFVTASTADENAEVVSLSPDGSPVQPEEPANGHNPEQPKKSNGIFHEVSAEAKQEDTWQYIDARMTPADIARIKARLREEEQAEAERMRQSEYEDRIRQMAEEAEKQRRMLQQSESGNGVAIVNATGNKDNAKKALQVITGSGLQASISESSSGAGEQTMLIVSRNDEDTIKALADLPFPCIRVMKEGKFRPTLIIGKDFSLAN